LKPSLLKGDGAFCPQKLIVMETHIGKKVRELRIERRMTTKQLAKQLGITRQAVGFMEKRAILQVKWLNLLGRILEHNFWQYYMDVKPAVHPIGVDPKLYQALKQENEDLKKELNYLREINQLLRANGSGNNNTSASQ
jgi:transcriptional regulator with XRE-family HTH domain